MVAGRFHHGRARPDARMVLLSAGASMVSFGRAPYKSVLMHGFTLDDQGRKMSKSIGNIVQPEEVVQKYGADILRFYVLGANAPWEDLHFSWDAVENTGRMLNIFWNAYRFCPTLHDPGQVRCLQSGSVPEGRLRPEDRWILSRVNSLAEEIVQDMDQYRFIGSSELYPISSLRIFPDGTSSSCGLAPGSSRMIQTSWPPTPPSMRF